MTSTRWTLNRGRLASTKSKSIQGSVMVFTPIVVGVVGIIVVFALLCAA